jgi:response regulator RpfG family c-di-GMP phosphodiesterase/signal transduction histidine kinase
MGMFNKNKEESKKISPVILEGFINKVKDIILTANYDGIIETINKPELKEIYKTLGDFFEKENNLDLYNNIINQIMEEGSFVDDIELKKNNQTVRMYVAAYNVPSNKKMFFYIKDTNQYLLKEMQLLEELDKQDELLKMKDLFIANLSHEIKTPMNIIVGMIYFLKGTNLDDKQLEYVNKLDEASKLLLDMTSGVLNLSQADAYTGDTTLLADFNLKKFIDNIIEIFEEKASSKNLQLYANLDFDTNINIHADKTKLNQIFMNLIDNAIKYTDKGYIEISGRKIEENNICYKFQFCLKDTGVGIKKEDTLKIFREFSQVEDPTKKTREGKGMGLAIVKKIIEDMNGKIWVESSVGLGSKFYFDVTLDKCNRIINENELLEEKKSQKPKTKENIKKDPNRQKRILLVEDNQLNIEITKKIIEEAGYLCDVAEDGIECIKQVKKIGIDYYDLILMDIHLPRYNGYEISKILKQDLEIKIPIVALTATNVTEKIVKENANYILDYILKPITPVNFKEKLKMYLEKDVVTKKENTKKKNILLLGEDIQSLEELKDKLSVSFDVVSTTSDPDTEILLQTDTLQAVVIDEMEDLDREFNFINRIRCDSKIFNMPIILINKNTESKLKERAYQIRIDGIVENYEIEQCETAVCNILSKIEEKNSLKDMVEKSKEETENVYNFLFDSMVNLTSIKSKETGQHLKRTKEYMKVMLAKYEEFYNEGLFTNKETIEDIAMAAVLHDIGKVGIPDNILNKPGKLTDEEYEIMKSHVTIGRDILETTYGNKVSNKILNYAKDIVYHHHEKYDGTGYPEHLKGEEISVISRNMALVDVYDALANKRVYKPALPYEEIEEYIKEQSGKAFDSKVVNVFFLVKDKLKEINENNKDK